MDIGKQQRVIIVEEDDSMTVEPAQVEKEPDVASTPEGAAAWPLPLDVDPEPVG